MNNSKRMALLKEYVLISFGVLFVAFGVYFFKFPNNFAIGGVTGVSMILNSALKGALSPGLIVLILNTLLLVLLYVVMGPKYGNRTLYGSVLFSLVTYALEFIIPMDSPITDEPMLELAFAVIFPAIGTAILFNIGSSTGGTDIIAMILRKYTNLDIGRSLLLADFFLTLLGFLVFSTKTVMLSLLGLLLKTTLVDEVIENLNLSKYFTIITDKPEEVCSYIMDKLGRSATVIDGKGAFSREQKSVILSVTGRYQAVQLRTYIKEVDPDAFILITNSSEIIGKGFRE